MEHNGLLTAYSIDSRARYICLDYYTDRLRLTKEQIKQYHEILCLAMRDKQRLKVGYHFDKNEKKWVDSIEVLS